MQNDGIPADLISATMTDIQESIAALAAHRAELERQIEEIDRQVVEKEARLEAWRKRRDSAAQKPGSKARTARTRRPRGENHRVVEACFSDPAADQGFSLKELQRRTDLGPSSLRAVLTRPGAQFTQQDGRWFKTAAPESTEDGGHSM